MKTRILVEADLMENDDFVSIVKTQMEMQQDMALSISSLASLVRSQGQQIEQLATELKRCAGAVNQLITNHNVLPFARPTSKDE